MAMWVITRWYVSNPSTPPGSRVSSQLSRIAWRSVSARRQASWDQLKTGRCTPLAGTSPVVKKGGFAMKNGGWTKLNHDFMWDFTGKSWCNLIFGLTILTDFSLAIRGRKIRGIPWNPKLGWLIKNTLIYVGKKKLINIKYLPKRDSNSWRNLKLNQDFVLVASKILSEESIKKNLYKSIYI